MTATLPISAPAADLASLTGGGVRAAQAAAGASKKAGSADIAKVARDFEAMFLSQMFQCMFEGVKADTTFGGGNAENMYRSMMIDEYGKQVAKRGGIGIADQVSRTLLAAQEKRI
jgi:Rod binding domain-containing protein